MTLPTLGAMRHRFALEAPVRTPDAAGGVDETWETAAEIWGALTALSGNETFVADKRSGRVSHEIMARAHPGFAPSHRLRLGPRIFEIRAVTVADERRRRVRLLCEERDL